MIDCTIVDEKKFLKNRKKYILNKETSDNNDNVNMFWQ